MAPRGRLGLPRGFPILTSVSSVSEMNWELGASLEAQTTANLDISTHTAFKVKARTLRKELPSSHSRPAYWAGEQSKFCLFLC